MEHITILVAKSTINPPCSRSQTVNVDQAGSLVVSCSEVETIYHHNDIHNMINHYPYAPCMEYLPTFAPKITQM